MRSARREECRMSIEMHNGFECAKFVGLIVLSFLLVCHLLWQRIEVTESEREKEQGKNCQCEVGAYVIFGLLIYSVLK